MKKKILSGAALLTIAAGAVFNVSFNSPSDNLPAMTLANVEALAGGEVYKGDNLYKTECTYTNYYYGTGGKLEQTVTYKAPCCVAGSSKCHL